MKLNDKRKPMTTAAILRSLDCRLPTLPMIALIALLLVLTSTDTRADRGRVRIDGGALVTDRGTLLRGITVPMDDPGHMIDRERMRHHVSALARAALRWNSPAMTATSCSISFRSGYLCSVSSRRPMWRKWR